jgi:hypothetical protein
MNYIAQIGGVSSIFIVIHMPIMCLDSILGQITMPILPDHDTYGFVLQAGTASQFVTITSLHDRERQQHLMVKYSKGGISVVVFQLKSKHMMS